MPTMGKFDWIEDPKWGSRGWLVMTFGTSKQYQQPQLGVLLVHATDEEGKWHWKIIGSALDGALYPTSDVAMAAAHIVLDGKEEEDE